jgi:hypothetical protein
MILTAESQEKIIDEYMSQGHSMDQIEAFIDGFKAGIQLCDTKMLQKKKEELEFYKN